MVIKKKIRQKKETFLISKSKIALALILGFIITEGAGFAASTDLASQADYSKEALLASIAEQKALVTELLKENEAKLQRMKNNQMDLVRKGDWYSTPWNTSYFGSFLFSYNRGDHKANHWVGSRRKNTSMDKDRESYNAAMSGKDENTYLQNAIDWTNKRYANGNLSTGWLNNTEAYNQNTNLYDYRDEIMILPVITPPEVIEPTAPVVTFNVPAAPTVVPVDTPEKLSLNVGAINVSQPVVNAPNVSVPNSPAEPGAINVNVNEPTVTLNIGAINVAGPGTLTIPSLNAPTVTASPSVVTPPSIIPPNPQVAVPQAPAAPNFAIYVAPGGTWLNWSGEHGSIAGNGVQGYNPLGDVGGLPILAASTTTLQGDPVRPLTDVVFPLFANMNINGGGGNQGKIFAYRTNDTTASTGYTNIESTTPVAPYTPEYYSQVVTPGTPIPGSAVRPGYTPGTILTNSGLNQKNRWVFHVNGGTYTINNIEFTLGGPEKAGTEENGVMLMRNDGNATISNSVINLLGRTTINTDILHYGNNYGTSLTLTNDTINIIGDNNTLFNNVPYSDVGYWATPDINIKYGTPALAPTNAIWGKPMTDIDTVKKGITGKTDLDINTKQNVTYVIQANSSYRWNINHNSAKKSDGTYDEWQDIANPEHLVVYTPLMGRVRYENIDTSLNHGKYNFNGSGNVGVWLNKYTPDRTQYTYNNTMPADYAPILDPGILNMNGDSNVGIYFAQNNTRPDYNGIYQGKILVEANIGVSTNSAGGNQLAAGNTDGDDAKSSGNVALYVSSGQRTDLTVANGYFPATTNLIAHSGSTPYITSDVQVGYTDLNIGDHAIKNLELSNFKVAFGQFSKNNIAVVARNGSVVTIDPASATDISDNANSENSIVAFAEGVWYNPRPAYIASNDGTTTSYLSNVVKPDGTLQTVTPGGPYQYNDTIVTDGTAGQVYVPDYGSEVNLKKDITLVGKNSTVAFAKDGAKITTKNITMTGPGSTAVFAYNVGNFAATHTLAPTTAPGGNSPVTTEIEVTGNITANNASNDNKGAVAISNSTTDSVKVKVTGNVIATGLGLYAKGQTASVTTTGTGSDLISGADGSIIALSGGQIEFGGGTITHDIADKLAFYADSTTNSKINFTGATTLDISKGIVFYGDSSNFTGAPGTTTTYNGMANLTVNLTDDGVNLGVFRGVTANWAGNASESTYLGGLTAILGGPTINSNGKWYKSSLENSTLLVTADVDRDNISVGATKGDGFNDIVMERTVVTLDAGKTIKSLAGNTLAMGSNATSNSNTEAGYVVKGTVDIAGGSPSVGTYTSYGHTHVENGGEVKTDGGVAAYGVNGSEIINRAGGKVTVGTSSAANQAVGMMALATNTSGTADTYGKDVGKAGSYGNIENYGDINIGTSNTDSNGIAIYMNNNKAGVSRSDMTLTNQAVITMPGDQSTAIAVKSNGTNGATIKLNESASGLHDLVMDTNSIGVYAEDSDIIFGSTTYGVDLKEGGVALVGVGNTTLTPDVSGTTVTVEYFGASGVGNTAMALAFKGQGTTAAPQTFTNPLNLNVVNTNGAETLVGIYGELDTGATDDGNKIINNGDINVETKGAYGILSKQVDIENNGTITVGDTAATDIGAVGIYAENADVTTDGGKIVLQGDGDSTPGVENYPIGIYAKNASGAATPTGLITVGNGSGAMLVNGKAGIGVYIEDTLGNSALTLKNASDITLADSANNTSDRKIAIYQAGTSNDNENSGTITVGQNNIGIYNKNAVLTNTSTGVLDVTANAAGTENIGIHNVADGGSAEFTNLGTVNADGVNNVGISVETNGTDAATVTLGDGTTTGGAINVTAQSMGNTDIPLGVYANGNNVTITGVRDTAANRMTVDPNDTKLTVKPNAIGIYMDGDNTSTTNDTFYMDLSSENTADKVAIGAYFKGGSFADNVAGDDTMKFESTATATDAAGEPNRPIGLFYGSGSTQNKSNVTILASSNEMIGMYANGLTNQFINDGNIDILAKSIGAYFKDTDVVNNGDITIDAAANDGYGLYIKGATAGTSENNGNITANATQSIGSIVSGSTAELTNKGTINSNASGTATERGSMGVYVEDSGKFINDTTGTLNSTVAESASTPGSVGAFAKGADIENKGTVNTEYLGLYGKAGSTVDQTSGTIAINSGIGILVEDTAGMVQSIANINGGTITGTNNNLTGVVAKNTAAVNLNGANIILTGSDSVGVYSDTSDVNMTSGDMTLGDRGVAVFAENSNIDPTAYTGLITMGNEGIAFYSNDNNILGPSTVKVAYTGSDKGVGVYYIGTTPVVNEITFDHQVGGQNLVHIYANGVDTTNLADQKVLKDGIGFFGDNGAVISNQSTLDLDGDGTVGIYMDKTDPMATGVTTLTDLGTIVGSAANVAGQSKVGVYVKDGDIIGSAVYNFDIDGGVGIYLVNNVISYTGDINLLSDSTSGNRAIGMYLSAEITGNIQNNINMTGKDSIGIYLNDDPTGTTNVLYDGHLTMTSTTSTVADRSVGIVLGTNTSLALGTNGKVDIGGNNNNIGFFVQNGASLNINGGQVVNTPDGIFAYIQNGTLNFTAGAPININYANVSAEGAAAQINNDTTIEVGTRGLQGLDGAHVTNSSIGVINGTVDEAKALVGSTNAVITNDGVINLAGDKSVAIYADSAAVATSNGSVTVGDKSVAYYAGEANVAGAPVGGIININGTTTIGQDATMMFANGGTINYNGSDINMGDQRTTLTLNNGNSHVDFGGSSIIVGKNGVGIFTLGTGDIDNNVVNLPKIVVGKEGTGIYIDNAVPFTNSNNIAIEIADKDGLGVLTTSNGGIIDYHGNVSSTTAQVKGLLSTAANTLENSGNVSLTGASSIGMYGENSILLQNNSTGMIEVGAGSIISGNMESSVGMYGKNVNDVVNNGTVKLTSDSVGIYGENAAITNNGTIQNNVGNNTGIYGVGGSALNTGNISLGDTSNGMFVKNGTRIDNFGDINVGDEKSAGIYGGGTTDVYHNGGTVTVGKNSVGIASEDGNATVASGANIVAGEKSTYVYSKNGTATLNQDISLSDYSMGMYTENGTAVNNANMTVGQSSVITGNVKVSVGMATGTYTTDAFGVKTYTGGGTIINNGTIDIPLDNGVGMVANNPTGKAENYGTINVMGDDTYGMEGSEGSSLTNYGLINVTGSGARGIAATGNGTKVENAAGASINVSGTSSEGIYVDRGAEVLNNGLITVDGASNTGIYLGENSILNNSGTGTIVVKNGATQMVDNQDGSVVVGNIKITNDAPTITVGDKVYDTPTLINNGYIQIINSALDFGQIKIGSTDGYIGTISADTFTNGELIVLPTQTQGNNREVNVVQYLQGAINIPNNGAITAISHSVTWLADIQADPNNSSIYRVVTVKIPYQNLTQNTGAYEFGKGLDEIYPEAKGVELEMFDAIDTISDKDELGSTFDMELRGNLYANLQQRMYDINEVFQQSYDNLKDSRMYTRDSLKIGAIVNKGKVEDHNPGIENYDSKTYGAMIMKEYEHRTYGRKSGWDIGFTQTKYDYDYGSDETTYSVNLGVNYEDYVGKSEHLKWHTRGEVTINKHDTDRKIYLSTGTYTNNAKYWSGVAQWKNMLRYEIPTDNAHAKVGLFATFNLGYGKFQNIKETGDGIYLDIKEKNMFIARPGIGADVTFTKYLTRGKLMLKGKATAEYEMGKFYDGPNQAKIKGTSAGYYDLEKPKQLKGIIKLGAELKYETKAGHSIGVEVVRREANVDSTNYGVNMTYRFGK